MITIENWVPAAKSKPLVKLADSAMRFTHKESESPSAFTVAERNVCALTGSEDSDGSGRDGRNGREVQPHFVAALTLGSKSSGCRRSATMELENCMFEALGQAFAEAGKSPTDARTVRTAVVTKMMILEENFTPVFCGTDGAGEPCTWRRYCTWA